MVLYFLFPYAQTWGVLNLFRYISFRTGGAILTALILSFYMGPRTIRYLRKLQKKGQPIREDGPEGHLLTKLGTPTMGGVMIIVALGLSVLIWGDLTQGYVWLTLLVTLGFGGLGALDDYLKLRFQNSKGLSARTKSFGQITISCLAGLGYLACTSSDIGTVLTFPFLKNVTYDLGWLFIPWGVLVLVGASNAVNLTDGLDGLAIGPSLITAGSFLIISYLVGHQIFAEYLHIHFTQGSGELTVVCGAFIGAGLGFLWFNAPPAQVFMGDTGSLAVGGLLGMISIITKHEIVLAIIGGLFVVEAVSVILQVGYFKLTRKRIFLMAPIHHHFEKKGWAEATIVIRFWIISFILALVGLSSLKIR